MMNGYNFTERVRRVLQRAREEAIALRHEYVGTEHILLGLLGGGGVAESALQNLGTNLDAVRAQVLETVKPGRPNTAATAAAASGGLLGAIADTMGFGQQQKVDLPYTSRAKKVLELSMTEARELRHSYVGTEHLLLGLLREERGIAAQILTSTGLTIDRVRDEVTRLLGTSRPEGSEAAARRDDPSDTEAAITVVIEHPDGRIEAKKFRRSGDAVSFLTGLEY